MRENYHLLLKNFRNFLRLISGQIHPLQGYPNHLKAGAAFLTVPYQHHNKSMLNVVAILFFGLLFTANTASAQTAPTLVGNSNVSVDGATINWVQISGTTYLVEVYNDNTYTSLVTQYTAQAGGSVDVTGVTSGNTYYYRISATGGTTYVTGSFVATNNNITPLIATGYTADVIANGTGVSVPNTTTASVDNPTGYSYYANGFQGATAGGLPTNRAITSPSGAGSIPFLMQPYSNPANNATNYSNSLRLGNTAGATGTLTLTKPARFKNLYFAEVCGSGPGLANITVNFSDGTSQVTNGVTFGNWDTTVATGTPTIVTGLGRANRGNNNTTGAYSTGSFWILQLTVPVTMANQSKTVASITFTRPSSPAGTVNIFAVSGQYVTECPDKPTISMATPTATSETITLATTSWGLEGTGTYTVEAYTDSNYTIPIAGSPFTGITGTTYNVTGLSPSTTYYFRVKAVNSSCNSAYATAQVTTPYSPCTVPTVPGTITLTPASTAVAGTITASDGTGYLVIRSTSATLSAGPVNNTTYTTSSTIGGGNVVAVGTGTTFNSTGLTANTTYYYFVYAYNTGATCVGPVYSTTSSTASTTTCIAAPLIVGASNVKNSSANLNWTKSAGVGTNPTVTYTLEVYTDANYTIPFTGSPFTGLTTARKTIGDAGTQLIANAIYYWRVRADQSGQCSSSWATSNFKAENTYTPIDVDGYTTDVIANGVGIAMNSTGGAVDGASNAYIARDYNPTGSAVTTVGLPLNRNLTGSPITGLKFFLEDYAAKNSIRLGAQNESATINLTVPLKMTDMYIAVTGGSVGNTGLMVNAVINFDDSTTQTVTGISFLDWYAAGTTAQPQLIDQLGRANRSNTVGAIDQGNSKIFQITIPINVANQNKKVTGVTFTKTTTGATEPVANIFAISAKVIGDCPTMASANTSNITSTGATVNAVLATAGEGLTTANVWYKVEVFTNSNFTGAIVGSPFTTATGVTSQNIPGLSPFTAYYYRVTAVNSACESSSVTGNFTTLMTECLTPSAPTFAITGSNATSVTGTITAPATAPTGYVVIRSTSATLSAAPVNATSYTTGTVIGNGTVVYVGTSTAVNDASASSNTLYYYYIYSYNTGSSCAGPIYSANAATANATTCVAQTIVVGASNIKNSSATLNWTSVSGGNATPVTYTLEVFTDAGYSNAFAPAYTGITAAKYSVSGLTAYATYYYRVSSVSASACTTTYNTGSFIAQNSYTPIDVTSGGYNTDVIANGSGAAQYSATHAVDATAAGHSYMSLDYKSALGVATTTGLPVNRFISSTTTSGLNFIIPDYNGNNCLRIESQNASGTLTFETAVKLTDIYIATTGGSGELTISAEILFADGGASQLSTGLIVPDWVGGTVNPLTGTLGRVSRIDATGTPETGTAAKIFQVAIPVNTANQTRKVSGVKFTKTSDGLIPGEPVANIFAISGKIIGECPTMTSVTATAASTESVNLNWVLTTPGDNYTTADVTYTVETYTSAAYTTLVGTPVTGLTGNSYTVTGLSPNTPYYFRVKAVNASCESLYVTANATTNMLPCSTPLSAISVAVTSSSSTTVTGTITAPATAPTGYLVIRSTTATLSAGPVNNTIYTTSNTIGGGNVVSVGTGTTFTNTGLTANTTYYYFVYAYNNGATCGGPVYSTIAVTGNATTCAGAVLVIGAADIHATSAKVIWNPINGGTYTLEVYTNAGYTALFNTYTGITTPYYNVSGLTTGATYYYRVKADNLSCADYGTGSFVPANSYTPLSITGYTKDVIANGTGSPTVTSTAAVDAAGSNYAYYSLDYKLNSDAAAVTNGLPVNRNLTSSGIAALKYILNDYSENNSLRLDVPASTNGTLTLGAPTRLTDIYFAVVSGSTGSTFSAEVQFTDGTSQTGTGLVATNWDSPSTTANPQLIQNMGRVVRSSGFVESGDFKIFQASLAISAANQSKIVKAVKITNTTPGASASQSILNVFAVSGKVADTPCYEWTGTANSNWNNVTNWCGGALPTTAANVTIPATSHNPVISSGVAYANNLTVNEGAILTVNSGATLTVQNAITSGTTPNIIVENNGAIVQGAATTDNQNFGKIIFHKFSNPLYRLDYTLWSAPTSGQMLRTFSMGTSNNRFYIYDYAFNGVENIEGYWPVDPLTTYFTEAAAATGYLIRMPNTITSSVTGVDENGNPSTTTPADYISGDGNYIFDGTFTGTPNNGNYSPATVDGGNGFTAVGNPYPSPISLGAFLSSNVNNLLADTGLWFWRKKNASATSYLTLNLSGLVTPPSDTNGNGALDA